MIWSIFVYWPPLYVQPAGRALWKPQLILFSLYSQMLEFLSISASQLQAAVKQKNGETV